jgi:protein-disulfide isomerase
MKLLIFVALISLSLSQQIPPVPSTPDGQVYGPGPNTNYTLDVFYDHLCPYSAEAFPTLYHFWINNQYWLRMVMHMVPLPYHYYSFDVTRAGRFLQAEYGQNNFTAFLTWIFNHQSRYLETAQSWDQPTLFSNLANDANTATGINSSIVLSALSNDDYEMSARLSWKFAMSKGITGTPTYMLNGVIVPAMGSFSTYQDWQNFFNSLS